MRKGLISLIVLAAVGAAVGWFLSAPQRLDADTVAALGEGDATRGQRIFWAGGCASCHAAPKSEGEARRQLGGGAPLVTPFGSFVPPILRGFAKAQPRVRVSLVCEDSKVVREQLKSGGVDLALTTETECGRHGETLRTDRLVWVGTPGGDAHLKDPLPVSLGAPTCVFRPIAIEALGKTRRDWRAVCEVSRLEPVYAVLEAGLAVAPLLRSSVPERFEILAGAAARAARLPSLPEFRINLYAPPGLSPAARDLADHVRASFSGRPRGNQIANN